MMETFNFGFKPDGYDGPAISVENNQYEGVFPEGLENGTRIFSYKVVYYGWEEVGYMEDGEPIFMPSKGSIEHYYHEKGAYDDGRRPDPTR